MANVIFTDIFVSGPPESVARLRARNAAQLDKPKPSTWDYSVHPLETRLWLDDPAAGLLGMTVITNGHHGPFLDYGDHGVDESLEVVFVSSDPQWPAAWATRVSKGEAVNRVEWSGDNEDWEGAVGDMGAWAKACLEKYVGRCILTRAPAR
jgi:hypothetical protein